MEHKIKVDINLNANNEEIAYYQNKLNQYRSFLSFIWSLREKIEPIEVRAMIQNEILSKFWGEE